MTGIYVARDMNNSDKASAQRYRDSFDVLKLLAIRDPNLWEVMEECYQFGWDWGMQCYGRQGQRSAH